MGLITEQQAESIIAEGERLQAENRRLSAELEAATVEKTAVEERCERLVMDVDNLEVDRRTLRRQVSSLTKSRNEQKKMSAHKTDIEFVWGAYYDRLCELHPRRKRATLGEVRWDAIERALKAGFDRDVLAAAVVARLENPMVVEGRTYDDISHALLKKGKVDETRIEELAAVVGGGEQGGPLPSPAVDQDGQQQIDNVVPMSAARSAGAALYKPSPAERAIMALGLEFGSDRVTYGYDGDRVLAAEQLAPYPRAIEAWCPCPNHPTDMAMLRVRARGGGPLEGRVSVEFTCVRGCEPEKIAEEVRVLEFRQEQRQVPAEPLENLLALVATRDKAAA